MVKNFILLLICSCLLVSCSTKNTINTANDFKVHKVARQNTNVYFIELDRRVIMIDAGYPDHGEKLVEDMEEMGLDPKNIDLLILTHAHDDHVGSASFFKKTYGTKVLGGKGDLEDFRAGKNGPLCPTSSFARILKSFAGSGGFPPIEPDFLIEKKYSLSSLGWPGEVMPVSGHTPGSLVIRMNDMLFVGDVIRGKPISKGKPSRHYFMCDTKDNDEDIDRLLSIKGIKTWYPGHFGPLSVESIRSYRQD